MGQETALEKASRCTMPPCFASPNENPQAELFATSRTVVRTVGTDFVARLSSDKGSQRRPADP